MGIVEAGTPDSAIQVGSCGGALVAVQWSRAVAARGRAQRFLSEDVELDGLLASLPPVLAVVPGPGLLFGLMLLAVRAGGSDCYESGNTSPLAGLLIGMVSARRSP